MNVYEKIHCLADKILRADNEAFDASTECSHGSSHIIKRHSDAGDKHFIAAKQHMLLANEHQIAAMWLKYQKEEEEQEEQEEQEY